MGTSFKDKLNLKLEIKSPPDKYWEGILNATLLFPKAFPEQHQTIEVLEGDGKTSGSVILIKFFGGVPSVTKLKEKLELVDAERKVITYNVLDGEIMTFFKTIKVTVQILANGSGSVAKWDVEYEKLSAEAPDMKHVMAIMTKTFQEFDDYLMKN